MNISFFPKSVLSNHVQFIYIYIYMYVCMYNTMKQLSFDSYEFEEPLWTISVLRQFCEPPTILTTINVLKKISQDKLMDFFMMEIGGDVRVERELEYK